MKRLVLLTVILVPSAYHAIGNMSIACRPPVTIGPREGRGFEERTIARAAVAAGPFRVVRNLPSATPERAREEARRGVDRAVARWLAPAGVPDGWTAPAELLRPMVHERPLEVVRKDYAEDGRMYVQPLALDASAANRDRLLEAYERELAGRRLASLAGLLAFVLTCLAAVAGYIHADEATRGYYTNTLRATAVAAVGAVGAVLYYALA